VVCLLVRQVVEAVRPIPVVAASSIFGGRGLAAALVLCSVGVNVGTRFLASREATISGGYKQAILAAAFEDAANFDALNDLLPSPGRKGYGTVLHSIKTRSSRNCGTRPSATRLAGSHRGPENCDSGAGEVHTVMPTAG
jgi:Nitronate monooxygenase